MSKQMWIDNVTDSCDDNNNNRNNLKETYLLIIQKHKIFYVNIQYLFLITICLLHFCVWYFLVGFKFDFFSILFIWK